jgi:TolA-binding protein
MTVDKKKAAIITAAVAAHLSKPTSTERSSDIAEVQRTLALLTDKVAQIEKQLEEMNTTIQETKSEAKRKKK